MSLAVRFAVALLALGALFAVSSEPAAAATVTVEVGDIYFCDPSFQGGVCDTTINVGDTVVWDFTPSQLPHTTTECGASCDSPTANPLWDSGTLGAGNGGTFEYTFNQPGTFLYYCEIHPFTQRGRIIVQGGTPTPTDTPPALATPTGTQPASTAAPATATPGPGLPVTGAGAPGDSSGGWWALALLGAAGVLLAGLGAAAYRRAR